MHSCKHTLLVDRFIATLPPAFGEYSEGAPSQRRHQILFELGQCVLSAGTTPRAAVVMYLSNDGPITVRKQRENDAQLFPLSAAAGSEYLDDRSPSNGGCKRTRCAENLQPLLNLFAQDSLAKGNSPSTT